MMKRSQDAAAGRNAVTPVIAWNPRALPLAANGNTIYLHGLST
jgi:hypothetical protein